MEKTRVPKGEFYYFLYFSHFFNKIAVGERRDIRASEDYGRFITDNYYSIKKEADSMARKLNAVLKGAEVIESPTPDEVYKECKKRNPHIDEESIVGNEWQEGFFACANFMKSKII